MVLTFRKIECGTGWNFRILLTHNIESTIILKHKLIKLILERINVILALILDTIKGMKKHNLSTY
jgi:hypothetical protein